MLVGGGRLRLSLGGYQAQHQRVARDLIRADRAHSIERVEVLHVIGRTGDSGGGGHDGEEGEKRMDRLNCAERRGEEGVRSEREHECTHPVSSTRLNPLCPLVSMLLPLGCVPFPFPFPFLPCFSSLPQNSREGNFRSENKSTQNHPKQRSKHARERRRRVKEFVSCTCAPCRPYWLSAWSVVRSFLLAQSAAVEMDSERSEHNRTHQSRAHKTHKQHQTDRDIEA